MESCHKPLAVCRKKPFVPKRAPAKQTFLLDTEQIEDIRRYSLDNEICVQLVTHAGKGS